MNVLDNKSLDLGSVSIKCPICGGTIILDTKVYWNYEGKIKCNLRNDLHVFYIKLQSGSLMESPEPIYFENPNFKSPPIPKEILDDFKESTICFVNNASTACIVMCGITLEGLTIDKKANGTTLNNKIKDLYDKQLISKPLYDAFSKVRAFRNIGAHYQPLKTINEKEAKNILDITKHVIDHIYILPELLK